MIPITELKRLPKVSGIYKVIDPTSNNILYIGKAKNIYHRWNNGHHKLGEIISRYGINVYITWACIPVWLLNRAENAAISFYKPPLNIKTPPVV